MHDPNCRGWKAMVNEWVNNGGSIVGKKAKTVLLPFYGLLMSLCSWLKIR